MNANSAATHCVNAASPPEISVPTLPTTTQPVETAAALPLRRAAAASSCFLPDLESAGVMESLGMDNKHDVIFSKQTAEENRKQLLKELTANIEQLCLALSIGSPNVVELQEDKGGGKLKFSVMSAAPSLSVTAAILSDEGHRSMKRTRTAKNYAAR